MPTGCRSTLKPWRAAKDRLKTLWLWHSAEESEHRSTAFDIYLALGGSREWRVRVFRYVPLSS
ncbi:MAG: metal-dependent hydrolase [Burkholderiales bacterium]|nr:metal-dependent hydrolase [Burkholderiales bacterium]